VKIDVSRYVIGEEGFVVKEVIVGAGLTINILVGAKPGL